MAKTLRSIRGCIGNRMREKSGGSTASTSTKKIRWRLASSFPRSLDTLFGSAEVLADRVRAMTGGNFDIRVYPGGELAGSLEVLDSVQQGSVQVGHSASYYYIGKILLSPLNAAFHLA